MKSQSFQNGFLLALVVIISAIFLWMVRSYIVTLLLAATFASLLRPSYLRMLTFTRERKYLASGLLLLIFFLVIVLPLIGFFGIVMKEAAKLTQDVTPWVQENLADKTALRENLHNLPGYKHIAPYSGIILSKITGTASSLSGFILARASKFTAGTLVFLVDFAIMLYAMFFFLIDGPDILKKILYYTPLKSRDEKKLLDKFLSMARSTLKVLIIIGVVQGTLAGVALWLAGIPGALLWGVVMAVLSVVPNIGSALIWLPACIYLLLAGKTTAGILVLLWCAIVVGSMDNILRPILVGKDTQANELLVLISTLGGFTTLGIEGFILGPVLAVVFVMIWEIYGEAFKDLLPEIH